MTRTIYKKRVGSDGKERDCNTGTVYVDIKETKKARYEQGTGRVYRKTIYQHCNESEKREYDETPEDKITFKILNDEDEAEEVRGTIPYLKTKGPNHGTVKRLWIEAGRGAHYQKTRLQYCNTADGSKRKTREQRVENEDTGDYIMVERITQWENEWGRGRVFQRKRIVPCHTEEQIETMDGDCKEIA